MSRGTVASVISIAVYYLLSYSVEAIHYSIDSSGLNQEQPLPVIINAGYNILFLLFSGFLAAFIYKQNEKRIAAIVGLILVVINFFIFILFPEEQNITTRLLKVILPLHAALIGGSICKKYKPAKIPK